MATSGHQESQTATYCHCQLGWMGWLGPLNVKGGSEIQKSGSRMVLKVKFMCSSELLFELLLSSNMWVLSKHTKCQYVCQICFAALNRSWQEQCRTFSKLFPAWDRPVHLAYLIPMSGSCAQFSHNTGISWKCQSPFINFCIWANSTKYVLKTKASRIWTKANPAEVQCWGASNMQVLAKYTEPIYALWLHRSNRACDSDADKYYVW